jgi:holo-[acyl-carrier protein] synthase
MILRTGIDLIEIGRLGAIRPAIRQRFLKRVYTPLELAQIGDSNASLAGRFAAKEAVAKALGTGIGPISWQDIEIRRGENGQPELHLFGAAADTAAQIGLETWSISISHDQERAVAVAVAIGAGPNAPGSSYEDSVC